MARIAWGPVGSERVLICNGTIRLCKLGGELVRELACEPDGEITPSFLDARWLPDGRIVAIDSFARVCWFSLHGERYAAPPAVVSSQQFSAADIAGDGSCYVAIGPIHLEVRAILGGDLRSIQRFDHRDHELIATLSHDGHYLALGYYPQIQFSPGRRRRWEVHNLTANTPNVTYGSGSEVVGKQQLAYRFAFDGSTGRRLAIGSPGGATGHGTIRLEAADAWPQEHPGGATAVALDGRGIRAAYAYRRSLEHRLRIDYLTPQRKGGRIVEILDTQWIDPGLQKLVSLAFDVDGHRIACLDQRGAFEIVPVP